MDPRSLTSMSLLWFEPVLFILSVIVYYVAALFLMFKKHRCKYNEPNVTPDSIDQMNGDRTTSGEIH